MNDSVAQGSLSVCCCSFVFGHCCMVWQEKGREDSLLKVSVDLLQEENYFFFFFF